MHLGTGSCIFVCVFLFKAKAASSKYARPVKRRQDDLEESDRSRKRRSLSSPDDDVPPPMPVTCKVAEMPQPPEAQLGRDVPLETVRERLAKRWTRLEREQAGTINQI